MPSYHNGPLLDGERVPLQYGTGVRCGGEGCGTVLSRYNPHTVCGACRAKMIRAAAFDEEGSELGFGWRRPVGRGALLDSTPPAEMPEPEPERQVPVDPIPAEDAPC